MTPMPGRGPITDSARETDAGDGQAAAGLPVNILRSIA
jgi:hypothetical protein